MHAGLWVEPVAAASTGGLEDGEGDGGVTRGSNTAGGKRKAGSLGTLDGGWTDVQGAAGDGPSVPKKRNIGGDGGDGGAGNGHVSDEALRMLVADRDRKRRAYEKAVAAVSVAKYRRGDADDA